MKLAVYITVFISLFMIGSACGRTVDVIESFDEEEEVILKIGHIDSRMFNLRYEALLNEYYPNISYEILDDELLETDNLEKWIDAHKPDIIFVPNFINYQRLVESGYLLEIEPLIKRDDFDIDSYISNRSEKEKIRDRGKVP